MAENCVSHLFLTSTSWTNFTATGERGQLLHAQWFKSRTLGMGMMHFFFCISIVVTD